MSVLKRPFCSSDLFAQENWKLASSDVVFPGKSDFLPVPRPLQIPYGNNITPCFSDFFISSILQIFRISLPWNSVFDILPSLLCLNLGSYTLVYPFPTALKHGMGTNFNNNTAHIGVFPIMNLLICRNDFTAGGSLF